MPVTCLPPPLHWPLVLNLMNHFSGTQSHIMYNQLFVEEEIEVNHIVHSVLSLVFCKRGGGKRNLSRSVLYLYMYVCMTTMQSSRHISRRLNKSVGLWTRCVSGNTLLVLGGSPAPLTQNYLNMLLCCLPPEKCKWIFTSLNFSLQH